MEVDARDLSGERGDVDDVAAPALEHPVQSDSRELHHREQVDLGDQVDLGQRRLAERADELEAGVVDEHVDRPDRLLSLPDQAAPFLLLGEVGGDGLHPGSNPGDLLHA